MALITCRSLIIPASHSHVRRSELSTMQKLKPLSRRLGRQGGPQEMADPIINRLEIDKTSAPMILIIGETGAGKSHFCNKVLGEDVDEVEESRGLASCKSGRGAIRSP